MARPLKTVQAEISYLDDDEADRLLEAARKEKGPWHPMVRCALHAALRLGELRGLRWRDVDTVAGRLVVRVSADDHDTLHAPKSGKAREIPLSSTLQGALKTHRHLRGEHVFTNDDGSILREDQCRHALQRIVRRAGLATDVRWHRLLRHTFASNLMRRGAPARTVQDLLGHSTLNMPLRYSHLSPLDRQHAVQLLDTSSGANRKTEKS